MGIHTEDQLPNGQDFSENLKKTEEVAALLQVDQAQRDQNWLNQLMTALPLASFGSADPQVIAGPDGFPYFQLVLPKAGETFQNFIIARMIPDFLLERGFGVVINAESGTPDWILSYGDVLNYQLNGSILTSDSLFSPENEGELNEGDEVLIGQPSENILPAVTRKLLRDFFELNGIKGVKVLLMMRKNGELMKQDLALNITPDQFESEAAFRNIMQTITWYLPRHYSLLGLHDDAIDSGFMSL